MAVETHDLIAQGGVSDSYSAVAGNISVSVFGRFSGEIVLERSIDAGVTWVPVAKDVNGEPVAITKPGAFVFVEVEASLLRMRAKALYSGTAKIRIAP
jgi:hypothetical protein